MNKFNINDRVWIKIFWRYATIIADSAKNEYVVKDDYGFTGIFKEKELRKDKNE